ncbi:hypothetical protein FNV43_RR21308 [Rhamnella rubrinervis]|uniref:Cytochrome P450 CYP736A12-like n=1 Tax=Rhamnella rubrinervis TaxID=2594499 RepID=A0A8K0DWE8_9ROSA|nr:hypothetical protein FNV43_RR21308 [Rhamnella rubrinervis]
MLTIFVLFLASLWFISILRRTTAQKQGKNGRKLPPGPPALPIIGNLHELGNLPHRNLQKLAKKYGPIMSIRLGTIPAIVISSPEAASLILKTHDTSFASRPKIQVSEYTTFGNKGLAFAEYGPYWRNIRKLSTLHLLSASKTESFVSLRKEGVGSLVQSLKKLAATGEVVDISEKVGEVVENIATTMILGRSKDDDRYHLKEIGEEALKVAGAFNLADYVPFIGALDLQGMTRRTKKAAKSIHQVLEKIITEHEQDTDHQHRDFVDMLLPLMNQPMNPHDKDVYIIDRTNIKAILLDMIVAAFDTSATAIEWAISELVRNPRVMKKLQEELQNVIGMDRMVEEKDLGKLSYLEMVVKETFRLHPVAPFLIPRECLEDTTIEGYYVPKKSRIMVNTWAIGHDRSVWSNNVEEFYPERFIERIIDVRGHDFELLPFGSGRRMCPGMHSGLITVRLVLSQLVHCFNWELPSGLKPNDLDMTEVFGLTMPRANHLLLKPKNRLLV